MTDPTVKWSMDDRSSYNSDANNDDDNDDEDVRADDDPKSEPVNDDVAVEHTVKRARRKAFEYTKHPDVTWNGTKTN